MENKWVIGAFPFILTTSTALAAYNVRNIQAKYRWLIGFSSMQCVSYFSRHYFLSKWKKLLPNMLSNENPQISAWWLLINCGIAMWMCNVFTGFFGGNKYYNKHGIDNYKKVIINSLCIGQCYFNKNNKINERYKSIKKLFRLSLMYFTGYSISKYLQNNKSVKKYIDSTEIIKYQFIGFLLSLTVSIINIPSIIHGISFGGRNDINIIEPYSFIYFNKSIREFWRNWSRPAGELFRYMIYEPLGGRNNIILSVSALFAMNCTFHYDLSFSLYGNKAYKAWSKAFGLMGITLTSHILLENYLTQKKKINIKENIIWKIFSYGLLNVSMITTLKIVNKEALIVTTSSLCNTFLMKPVFVDT